MFTRTGTNEVTSNLGFVVRVLGRTGIEYREEVRVAFVDSEVLVKGGMAISKIRLAAGCRLTIPMEYHPKSGRRFSTVLLLL